MATEKRLISLDEALDATHREVFWTESEAAAVRSFLVKQPKVDAVEVVHGRWEHEKFDIYRCSNCNGCSHVKEVMGKPDWGYCPLCGAKMKVSEET